MPTIRKKVKKFSLQEPYESRVIWRHLTAALEREDSEAASIAKHEVSGYNQRSDQIVGNMVVVGHMRVT